MTDDGLQNAGISPRERLERIERMLEKIDDKLDTKADAALVTSLQSRLEIIERDGTNLARAADRHASDARSEISRVKIKMAFYAGALAAASFTLQVALTKGWI